MINTGEARQKGPFRPELTHYWSILGSKLHIGAGADAVLLGCGTVRAWAWAGTGTPTGMDQSLHTRPGPVSTYPSWTSLITSLITLVLGHSSPETLISVRSH